MKMSVTLECECGNSKSYVVENKYHSQAHETYVDLTGGIYDDNFHAKPTPDGMWINCRNCKKGYEVV